MSNHTQIRWSVGAAVVAFIMSGCVTTQPEEFVSKCNGTVVNKKLKILVDGSGKPTGVVDADKGTNADVIFVCPGADITWSLPENQDDFTIRFMRQTPFNNWTSKYKKTKKAEGKVNVSGKVKRKEDIHCDGYKYAIEVGGEVLDPIIIVDR